jgi:hypothetical protein
MPEEPKEPPDIVGWLALAVSTLQLALDVYSKTH